MVRLTGVLKWAASPKTCAVKAQTGAAVAVKKDRVDVIEPIPDQSVRTPARGNSRSHTHKRDFRRAFFLIHLSQPQEVEMARFDLVGLYLIARMRPFRSIAAFNYETS